MVQLVAYFGYFARKSENGGEQWPK